MIALLLLGCAPIVIVERGTLELDPVTLGASESWSVEFQVVGSEAAMDMFYSGEVSALARDVDLEFGNTLTGSLQVGDQTDQVELNPEWESDLELWVKPWANCWAGSCTLNGELEFGTTAEATFTPEITGTLLLETHRRSLPEDATVEVRVVE